MVRAKGGYVTIDCTGLDLTKGATKQTITGIRKRVEDAYLSNKPVFVYNATWGATQLMSPLNVMITKVGDDYICTASTLQIYVEKTGDKVHIVNMVA